MTLRHAKEVHRDLPSPDPWWGSEYDSEYDKEDEEPKKPEPIRHRVRLRHSGWFALAAMFVAISTANLSCERAKDVSSRREHFEAAMKRAQERIQERIDRLERIRRERARGRGFEI